tara:strand:- start:2008 stop:2292 length:285 start_codon:yes stop_codon:yes gene_type:complete
MQRLEEILGSKNKIKLLRFLIKNRDWQFNLYSISKKIDVDKGNISRLIKYFEKEKIVLVKRSGKLLLFCLNSKNKVVQDLIIPIFKIEENARKS